METTVWLVVATLATAAGVAFVVTSAGILAREGGQLRDPSDPASPDVRSYPSNRAEREVGPVVSAEPGDDEGRERFVVALTGAPGGERLVRRAAELAQRVDGDLLGVHIGVDARDREPEAALEDHRRLLEDLGGELRELTATDVAAALLEVARAERATQIVLGASRRSQWHRLLHGSVVGTVIRRAGPIDVHVISEDRPAAGAGLGDRRAVLVPLSARRQVAGALTAVVVLPLLTLVLANTRDDLHLPTVLLLYLLAAMAVALVGGALPALAAAVVGLLLADWFFTQPLYELSVAETEEVVALAVYLASATIVSVLVDRVARLRLDAARATVEAEAMAQLAGSLAEPGALPGVVSHVRGTFGLDGAALFRRVDGRWEREAADGDAPLDPQDGDIRREVGTGHVLVLRGGPLRASDLRVLAALTGQLATAIEARRLQDEAEQAEELRQANDLRSALLQAVSHDLRSPLAGIKASVSSLRGGEVAWSEDDVEEFLRTIEDETDRLDGLVGDLLDMSRIQVGAVRPQFRAVALEEVVPAVLDGSGAGGARVDVEVPDSLPTVWTDPVLLERIVANLLDNALKAGPEGSPVELAAVAENGHVEVRVVDHGPGIPPADRERVFAPFQRTTDHGSGVGLGLAIVQGFVEALDADLVIEDTAGGGATMAVRLPVRPGGG